MRYFAILKDSFREARDSKVMYVLFALSVVAVILVGTMSFRPLSAQTSMEQYFPNPKLGHMSTMFIALYHPEVTAAGMDADDIKGPKNGKPAVDPVAEKMQPIYEHRLEKVELVRGEPDAPESDYVLTVADLTPRVLKQEDEDEILKNGLARVRIIFQKAEDLGFIRIGEMTGSIDWSDAKELQLGRARYRITLHGTPHTFRIWAHEPSLFFGAIPIEVISAPLSYQLYVLAANVVWFGAWVAILVGVVITSSFIPSMLSKGTVDMLLVKPIHRWALLLYKYIGGLTFILLNTTFAIACIWFMLGIRTGVWAGGLALLILTITFFFAILYGISTLVAVLTRSTIVSIVVTIGAWALLFAIGQAHRILENRERAQIRQIRRDRLDGADQPTTASRVVSGVRLLHAITPRTEELSQIDDRIVYYSLMTSVFDMRKFDTGDRPWWETLLVSGLWIGFFLGVACVWYSFKDY